eukprot:gene363-392_t
MDEIDNHPLALLFLLDQDYFTLFLEYAQSMGWVDLILFLLEVDVLRFKSDEAFHRLVNSRLPCSAAYQQLAEEIWKRLLRQSTLLTKSSNRIWSSLKRLIIDHSEIHIEEVLKDATKRKYFEKFLQVEPNDLACLQCYISALEIIRELQPFLLQEGMKASVQCFGNHVNHRKSTSILKRWRGSSKATLMNFQQPSSLSNHSHKGNLPTTTVGGAGVGGGGGGSSSSGGMVAEEMPKQEFSDALGALECLLRGLRSLQRQFFPVASQNTSSSSNTTTTTMMTNNQILGLNILNRSKRNGNNNSNNNNNNSNNNAGQTIAPTSTISCSGLSETLKMEIVSSLAQNNVIRLEDIEIIDPIYAITCCEIFYNHLHTLCNELHNYLNSQFILFQQSDEYITLCAQHLAWQSPSIQIYLQKSCFLSDLLSIDQVMGKEKVMHWADPRARGVLFLRYSLPTDAFKLEVCMPQDHLLTRDFIHWLPHRVRMWRYYTNNSDNDDYDENEDGNENGDGKREVEQQQQQPSHHSLSCSSSTAVESHGKDEIEEDDNEEDEENAAEEDSSSSDYNLLQVVGIQIDHENIFQDDQTYSMILNHDEEITQTIRRTISDFHDPIRTVLSIANHYLPCSLTLNGALRELGMSSTIVHGVSGNSNTVGNSTTTKRFTSKLTITAVMSADRSGWSVLQEANRKVRRVSSSSATIAQRIVLHDSYQKYWKKVLDLYQQVMKENDKEIHPVFHSQPCLYDLYLGSHLQHDGYKPTGSSSGGGSGSGSTIIEDDDDLRRLLLTYPITKHYGIYDTSISILLTIIPIRLLLQILMLLITNGPSIMLIGSSSSLLVQLQDCLPRLFYPFHIEHQSISIQCPQQLYQTFHIHKKAFTLYSAHPSASFVIPTAAIGGTGGISSSVSFSLPNSKSPLPSSMKRHSSQLLTELVPETISGSSEDISHSPLPLRSGQNRPSPLLSPSSSAPKEQYDINKKHLYFIDARSYHLARADLLNQTADLPSIDKREKVIAFDLDAGLVIESFLSLDSNGESTENCNNLFDLHDYRLFQSAHFDALRQLQNTLQQAIYRYSCERQRLEERYRYDMKALNEFNERQAEVILQSNSEIELAFHMFWTKLILFALPEHLLHFKEYGCIGCDIQSVLAQLLTINSNTMNFAMTTASLSSWRPIMTTSTPRVDGLSRENIRQMGFEDFLSFYNDHTAQAGRSLLHIFYADFFAGLSPVLLDLLRRHGVLLERWKF